MKKLTTLISHPSQKAAKHLDPDYCGECGGAPAPPTASKPGCCNTCDEVREAYAQKQWAFKNAENIEQCQWEGYSEKLESQRREGCRIEGVLRVNKVPGNFHIAPGRGFTSGNIHAHDLWSFFNAGSLPEGEKHTMTHEIHQLHFGPQLPEELSSRLQSPEHQYQPLDNTKQLTNEPSYNFAYFVKVVSTAYLPLGWDESVMADSSGYAQERKTPLGTHGLDHGPQGKIETHQYSVTSHKRSLSGGTDAENGHKERIHASDGIPGVFFNYDISPMKVINREVRPKTFTGFLTGVCAIVGGTLTVAAAIDRGLYEGVTRVKKLHSS